MEKIITKLDIIERLKNIKGVEILARRAYQEDLSNYKNKGVLTIITEIKNDKDRHVRLLDDLITFLK
ncbi:MAG: hypothetical protein V1663_02745 [archaeon]